MTEKYQKDFAEFVGNYIGPAYEQFGHYVGVPEIGKIGNVAGASFSLTAKSMDEDGLTATDVITTGAGLVAGAAATAILVRAGVPVRFAMAGGAFVGYYTESAVEYLINEVIYGPGTRLTEPQNLPDGIKYNTWDSRDDSPEFASETGVYTDPKSGADVQVQVVVNKATGIAVAAHVTVIDHHSPLNGMSFPVNSVKLGYELNDLDRRSEEAYARSQTVRDDGGHVPDRPSSGGLSPDERDERNGNPSSPTGNSGGSGGYGYQGKSSDPPSGGRPSSPSTGTSKVDTNHLSKVAEGKVKSGLPILLDLDGDGVEITSLDKSTQHIIGDDGLLHRTAWAGAGDGVLFVETDTIKGISTLAEYVFTEWDRTASDDMEALARVFDSDHNGKLDSLDARWGDFRVMRTNADGTTEVLTLTDLKITEINLRPDTTRITLPDGSQITGQTTFTMNGVGHIAANTTLVTEAQGYRVVEVVAEAGGTRTTTQTDYDAAA